MHTLEWILTTCALLGCLALLLPMMDQHIQKTKETLRILTEKNELLSCSAHQDAARSLYALVPTQGCWEYPYSIHSPPDPFTLTLGGDSNHYE